MLEPRQDSKTFLEVLFPSLDNEFIEARLFPTIKESKLPPIQRFYSSKEEVLGALPELIGTQSQGYGIYVGVCPRKEQKGTKEAVSCVFVLWADLDAKGFAGDKHKALEAIQQFKLKPTMIIDSGHGYHAYWLLKEAQTDMARVESCLKGIANAVNADSAVCEVSRVMRLPGSVNNKDEASQILVKIVEINQNAVYGLNDFDFVMVTKVEGQEVAINVIKSIGSDPILKGKRNSTLTSLAGSMFKRSLGYSVVLDALKEVNKKQCSPPLPDSEVEAIVKSISKGKFDSIAHTVPIVIEKKYFTINQLKGLKSTSVDWLWEGYLGKGYITLLSGWPKVGKTTLLFSLIKAIKTQQPFLNFATKQDGNILVITEEHSQFYKVRVEKASLSGEDVFILSGFEAGCYTRDKVLEQIELAIKEGVSLIVIDTLGEFWGVNDENSAPLVQEALKRFRTIAQKNNVAFLLIHHLRKSDGEHGTAHRGSGALLGAVDIGLEFKYGTVSNRRTISSKSRFHQTPPELMIEWDGVNYKSLGDPAKLAKEEVKKRFLEALSQDDYEKLEVISERMEPKPGDTLLGEIAKECRDNKLVDFSGTGKKGSPFTYKKLTDTTA